MFLVLSGLLYYIFFIWDQIIDPLHWQSAHVVRGWFVSPFMWLIAASLLLKAAQRYFEYLVLAALTSAQIGLAVIYIILDHGFDYGSVGAVLVFLGCTSMFPIRASRLFYSGVFAVGSFLAAHVIADNARPGMIVVNALSIFTAVVLGLFSAVVKELAARREFQMTRSLEAARGRIDELLYSMLPREIVARIQAGETAIADAYGEVSIVFADLVGFTELSRRISATHLVEILNSLFSEFDIEAERLGIEKIKTIGDAYMAVGGLSTDRKQPDHAERTAEFAFSMQRIVTTLSEQMGFPINVRIGLHVGPVVAGVIGTKRPAFDCWGESVNLASRLENGALPGGILISESAYWRLKGRFSIKILDDIDLKGIGLSKVYLLTA